MPGSAYEGLSCDSSLAAHQDVHALPTCPAEHAGNFNTSKQALHAQQFSLVHARNFLPVPMLNMAGYLEFPAHGLGCQADI